MDSSEILAECLGASPADDFPTLARAPITEALIDIRVTLPPDTTLDHLATFRVPFRERFTESKQRFSGTAAIKFTGPDTAPSLISEGPKPDGYFFSASEEKLIAQARLDGFTLSKLPPYENWRRFCSQFVELWLRYIEVAKPLTITRITLRYINTLELPLEADFADYLLTVPTVAPAVPQTLEAFLMRLVIPSQTGMVAIVTETNGNTSQSGVFPFIFDIEVFRDIDMQISNPEIWAVIRDLRYYKNKIFFGSLTPKTVEMFQ